MNTDLAVKSFTYDNLERWFEIVMKCTEFVSVNSSLGINNRTKTVFEQPWLTRFKSELSDQLILADPVSKCPWITESQVYFLAVKMIFKKYFWARDLDNTIKYTQDRIAEACHINDSHIIELHAWKNFRPGDYEYMIIRFGVSNYDYNQLR